VRPRCDHGSVLPVNGFDLVTIHTAMGHSALATAGRYLHAGPAAEQAARFTRAVEPSSGPGLATTAGALGSACIGVEA
jgi:hypothetical protein